MIKEEIGSMEQPINREELLRSLRAAIRSVRRTPVKIKWADDDRFFVEVRVPKMAERLDFYMAAQLVLAGFGGADRLISLLKPLILSFRLPVETEDGELKQAVYNAEPLPDIEAINLTPDDLFSDDSEFNASPLFVTMIMTEMMEVTGRTRTTSAGMSELMELFPTTPKNATNLLEQGSSGL